MDVSLQSSQRQNLQFHMSAQMLRSLSIMALPAFELRDYIYAEADRNPALEIDGDRDAALLLRSVHTDPDRVRLSSVSGSSEESDAYQFFIENMAGPEESLQEHLLGQLSLLALDEERMNLCRQIIQNLDERGFHLTPPLELAEGEGELLSDCLSIVQGFDPAGIACSGVEESLLIQARLAGDAPPFALLILDGYLSALETMKPALILKRLGAEGSDYTREDVEEAIAYIRTLDPHPARQFDSGVGRRYVAPDVRIIEAPDNEGGLRYRAVSMRGGLPKITVSQDFERLSHAEAANGVSDEQLRFIKDSVSQARALIAAVERRGETTLRVAEIIAERQAAFFSRGREALVSLRLADIAKELNLHPSTVSRAVNGKYLQCSLGIFELRFFFSSGVRIEHKKDEPSPDSDLSRESVKALLSRIIEEQGKGKPLSDSKLTALLAERGVRLARRTVAKYRSELNIGSSFERQK